MANQSHDVFGYESRTSSVRVLIRISPIQWTVDLPTHGSQLHPLLVSNKDGSTNDKASKEVLNEKTKEEAAKEKEVVVAATKQQKEAEIKENIQAMAKRLPYMFGNRPHTYTPCNRFCDVFGDPSHTGWPIRTRGCCYYCCNTRGGCWDNISDGQVGEDVVPMAKYLFPNPSFLPPQGEDDIDFYS
ncbi:hypothetical protein H5410_046899 [Solanum commersonii]|uniref:Uncharacterized protein n=1 Tax=Solanum commersonii TaxID=4109 RepID=A0A9J5XDI0_SOLCO|nr:hypothetical protein H5410_046899 [Solanum commersonii]